MACDHQGLIQADFDVSIPVLGTSIYLGAQIKKGESIHKEESQTVFKLYHFKQIHHRKPP